MEELLDWNFEDNINMSTNKRSTRPEDELVELLWRDGQVVLQSQTHKQPPVQETLTKPILEQQEIVSWIQYPTEDVIDPFESELSSHLIFSSNTEKPWLKHEAQTMAPPKFSHCVSNQSTNNHTTLPNVEDRLEIWSGGSSGCSLGRKETSKRKHVTDADQESLSQSRMISTDDQTMDNKSSQRSGSTRRSRAAKVHNLSERRRRDRINDRMKALQELIPNCTKTDKASILDEAIDYLKSLQIQLQVMCMGSGVAAAAATTTPMMFPGVLSSPYMNQMPSPQFQIMNRSVAHNQHGLVCQNPVQFQIQAQSQIISDQLARYMSGFEPATQPMEISQQSQLSAPATIDSKVD